MRISDWSSGVCSCCLSPCATRQWRERLGAGSSEAEFRNQWNMVRRTAPSPAGFHNAVRNGGMSNIWARPHVIQAAAPVGHGPVAGAIAPPCVKALRRGHEFAAQVDPIIRSEEHTSELPSLMHISYAVFCLEKK